MNRLTSSSALLFQASKANHGILIKAQLSKSKGLTPFNWDFPLTKSMSHPSALSRIFEDFDFPGFPATTAAALPLDVKETKDSYELTIDVPGTNKHDVHVTVKNRELVVSAKRDTMHKEEGAQFLRVERHHGFLSRSLALPSDADEGRIAASFEHGVLALHVPKQLGGEHQAVKKIDIK